MIHRCAIAVSLVMLVSGVPTWGRQNRSAASSESQRERITLGSVQLYLGESKTETITALVTAGLHLNPHGDSITVWTRSSNPAPVREIGFSTDRLNWVNKVWDPPDVEESSAYELARAIFLASQSLAQQGCESIHLSTESTVPDAIDLVANLTGKHVFWP